MEQLAIKSLRDISCFCQEAGGITLRNYQKAPALAIIKSIQQEAGRSFVIMFPRQSGKNELQAQLETYLFCLFYLMNGEMVKVSPTWKPQTLNAMRRLERVLDANKLLHHFWTKESGYIYKAGATRLYFFSGQPRSNIVGATANLLLEVDEAQDVLPAKFDKDIAPMAASTNATRVFWGTAWTSRTLLARELRSCRKAEKEDGIKRVFIMTANEVRKEVPPYGAFVDDQVKRLGRNHPMIKTQYFSEEIDAEGGLFPPERVAMMKGAHPAQLAPAEGKLYAATLDLAGEDEAMLADPEDLNEKDLSNPKRDSTALTVFEVDLETINDPLINKPSYKVIFRKEWIGIKHSSLYGQIRALAELFAVRFLVVDATGVGAGMCSFLTASLGERVIPFEFNLSTKSSLLWDFLGIIDGGRFKFYAPSPLRGESIGEGRSPLPEQGTEIPQPTRPQAAIGEGSFWEQVEFCQFEILPGPQKRVKWGVPDGTRNPTTGELVHDDQLISASLVAILDAQDWTFSAPTFVIPAVDPLREMDQGF